MKRLPRVGDLELDQDLDFERRGWKWQRVGWMAMALFVLAALLGNDFSVTNTFVLIVTLIGIDIGFSLVKARSSWFGRVTEGLPVVLVEEGESIDERTQQVRVDESDILEAARRLRGLERLDQIKYAVLERDGSIAIVPLQVG